MTKIRFQKKDYVLFILFKTILDVVYVTIQQRLFGYYGFSLAVIPERIVIGWLIFLFTGLFVQSEDRRITSVFIYTYFLLSLVPSIVYYQFNLDSSFSLVGYQFIPLIIMSLLFRVPVKNTEKSNTKRIKISNGFLMFSVVLFLGSYLLLMIVENGIPSLDFLSFSTVYLVRSEYEASTILTIVQNIVCKIVCPLLLFESIKEKKWFLLGFVVVVELYTYAVTGFKTYLFILVLSVLLSIFPKLNIKKAITIGLPLAALITVFEHLITKDNMLYALIIERVFFLPAKIKNCYFDYFEQHEFVYFSQSSFAKAFGISSNYSINIPNLIGEQYFGRPDMWTNTGFIADAFSNAGLIGVIIICGVLSLILLLARKYMTEIPDPFYKAIEILFVLYFVSLNDGGAISILFSGGMLALLLMTMFIDFNYQKNADASFAGRACV